MCLGFTGGGGAGQGWRVGQERDLLAYRSRGSQGSRKTEASNVLLLLSPQDVSGCPLGTGDIMGQETGLARAHVTSWLIRAVDLV